MIQELTEIKKTRKRLGLNQKELAKRAGVSQSLIAKIEAEKLEPSYSNAKKIFSALTELSTKAEAKARDLMNKRIIFAQPKEKIKEIIRTMKQKGISQMPVLKEGKVCGLISEKNILDKISTGRDISEMKTEDVMDDCPPIISLETSQRTVLELLKENSIILVAEKGEIKGIISKSDLLEKI